MSIYICEKCGCIENTALGDYWNNIINDEPIICSECSTGKWHNKFDKKHWTEYGVKKLLEREKDGARINATEYLKSIGELK